MKITWLGQFGVLIETANSSLMMDPYLTDSIAEKSGAAFRRLVPLQEEYLRRTPNVILLSHDHIDHLDIPSLRALLGTSRPTEVLASANAWTKVRTEVGGGQAVAGGGAGRYILLSEFCSGIGGRRALACRTCPNTAGYANY